MRTFTKYPNSYVQASKLDDNTRSLAKAYATYAEKKKIWRETGEYPFSLEEGQLVKVKPYNELKDCGWFVDDMEKYCGRTYEVRNVDVSYQPGFVSLDIPYGEYASPYLPDPQGWQFREDGLIPVN